MRSGDVKGKVWASKTVACSMCGPFCPMNLIEKFVQDAKKAREEVREILEKLSSVK